MRELYLNPFPFPFPFPAPAPATAPAPQVVPRRLLRVCGLLLPGQAGQPVRHRPEQVGTEAQIGNHTFQDVKFSLEESNSP